jgi:NAD(P)-dependent dehydrogenase (short-subunit alcohol dehydrogenase family)
MSYPIVLILGAGSNIGQGVAQAFASKGYKVALASRSIDEAASTDIQLHVRTDLSNPDEVVTTFEKVKKAFGFPSVVIYNGKCHSLKGLLFH